MSQNPILKDLTGNGHDITLHNFAWSGMSGIGGYETDFTKWHSMQERADITKYDKSFIINSVSNMDESLLFYSFKNINSFKIRVSGLSNTGYKIRYKYYAEGSQEPSFINIDNDGVYTIPATFNYAESIASGFNMNNRTPIESCNITIEQLPLYPGALVSDGVDDYGISENFPILTKEKGYTVVALRKPINTDSGVYVSKRGLNNGADIGAFAFEKFQISDPEYPKNCYSFGSVNKIDSIPDLFSYMTSKSYNGKSLKTGTVNDNSYLMVFAGFATITDTDYTVSEQGSCALYDLLIYDRDLTEEEINQLRDYFYQRDYEPLDSSLVDAWIFSGYKNEDAPDAIAGVKGTELTCYNFAWNEEGSGFKDGALWFDGVDDYLIGRNKFPILTDYTIIMKRNIFELGGYATVACKWIADEIKGNGAFLFELNGTPNNHIPKPNKTFSFSNSNEVGDNSISSDQIPELISWQTKNRYNGHEINSGIQSDGRNFTIGRKMLYGAFCKISVNYCALYDKSLTESEIQKEIQKLETLWSNRLNN